MIQVVKSSGMYRYTPRLLQEQQILGPGEWRRKRKEKRARGDQARHRQTPFLNDCRAAAGDVLIKHFGQDGVPRATPYL